MSILQVQGFVLLPQAIDAQQMAAIDYTLSALIVDTRAAGQRNLLSRSSTIRSFAAEGEPFKIACSILGEAARPVRAILFDKTPEANWYVTWHQDLTIPVKQKLDIEGYTAWSLKEDVIHTQPPAAVLEQMISLRLHFDDSSVDNGPIKFLPGSHLRGVLDSDQILAFRDTVAEVVCTASRRDIIAMRPLTLHASSQAKLPARRRVLHLEYTCAKLPAGLAWAEA